MSITFTRSGSLAISLWAVAVRQPAKGDVDLAPINLIGGDESRQVEGGEMREDLRERLPGVAFGDQRGEGDVGVAGGEPDQIGAGVTAGAEHCGPDLLGCHDEACLICVRSVRQLRFSPSYRRKPVSSN